MEEPRFRLNTCGILEILFIVEDAALANPPKLRPVKRARLFRNRPFLLSASLFALSRFLGPSTCVGLRFGRLRLFQKLPFSIVA